MKKKRTSSQSGIHKRPTTPKFTEVSVQGTKFRRSAKGIEAELPRVGWQKISSPIAILADVRDEASADWGRLLRWRDKDGKLHQDCFSRAELSGSPGQVVKKLLNAGLPFVSTDPAQKSLLCQYLLEKHTTWRMRRVNRVGWCGNAFVVPGATTIFDGDEEVLYTGDAQAAHWGTSGTLTEWREHVGRLCSGNSRLVAAVSAAFAGPLLAISKGESGGVHFYGDTSTGKTTALLVAGSVEGGGGPHGFLENWRTTTNALEVIALAHNDATLLLDELSQLERGDANEVAYLLGNGAGRARMNARAVRKSRAAWRLLLLSSGEMALSQHVGGSGRRLMDGAAARILSVPADAGSSLGLFEDLHGRESAEVFARDLKHQALRYYGTPFLAFLRTLPMNTADRESFSQNVIQFQKDFCAEVVPFGSSGLVMRAAKRFALIAFAGEYASAKQITGWPIHEARDAAQRLFKEWLALHGQDRGVDEALTRLRHLLTEEVHRFTPKSAGYAELGSHAGFVENAKDGEKVFLIFDHVFKGEICQGVAPEAVAHQLQRRGWLRHDVDRLTYKPRIPGYGHQPRFYGVRAQFLELPNEAPER